MSTHNIGFYEDLTKIIFHLSSNTHRISSSATLLACVSQWVNIALNNYFSHITSVSGKKKKHKHSVTKPTRGPMVL